MNTETEDYNAYCDRVGPARFTSPYELDPTCTHAVLIERTPEFVQPASDWSLPFGGFVLQVRDWQCAACLGIVGFGGVTRAELHYRDGKVTPAAPVWQPNERKHRKQRAIA